MNNKILVFFIMAASFVACKNPAVDEEVQKLRDENQMLQQTINQKDSVFTDYFATLNEIESNLETIKAQEKIISKDAGANGERSEDVKVRITEDMQLIADLMEQNRNLVARLNKNIKNSNLRIAELDQIIERLTSQLEEKEVEIEQLRGQLAEMNIMVGALTSEVDTLRSYARRQEDVISQKVSEINTGWYVFGTRKELVKENIISRSGGFLGIGRTNKMASDMNTSYFTKIDITKTKEITISGKKPKIVTSHPSTSYTLTGEGNLYKLVISDYNKFWTSSKYLVIEIQ
ncbi:MAG: hypothetical protein GX587_00200 [Bacteroidales bacterium]|nr:hypothetical protein [Bacteroidales bacterium]